MAGVGDRIQLFLREAIGAVLRECGAADPPHLREAVVDLRREDFDRHRHRRRRGHVRAAITLRFADDRRYSRTFELDESAYYDFPRRLPDRIRLSAEAQRLYSEMVENHLMQRELRSVERVLLNAENRQETETALQVALHQRYAELRAHVEQHHRQESQFAWPSRYDPALDALAPSQQDYIFHRRIEPETYQLAPEAVTATEARVRQEQVQQAFLEMARPYDRHDGQWYFGGAEITRDFGSKEANERGLALLKQNLTATQLAQYEKNQYFEVIGGQTGTRYRIRHGRQMNIEELDATGKRVRGLCFLPRGNLVAGDCLLAQKNALELCESEALRVANPF